MAIKVGSQLAWEIFPIMYSLNKDTIYLSCWSSTDCRLVVPVAIKVGSVLAWEIFPIMFYLKKETLYLYISCWSSSYCRLVAPVAIEVDSVLARENISPLCLISSPEPKAHR